MLYSYNEINYILVSIIGDGLKHKFSA